MTIKTKVAKIGKYWVDLSNNAWGIVYTSESDANRHSLNMMGCSNCINCYDMIDCVACRNCYNCAGCTGLMNAHDVYVNK